MANWQIKYYYNFRDLNNILYQVDIEENTTDTLTAVEIRADSAPFVTEMPEISTKFDCVRGTGCELNLISLTDRQLFDLYTGDMMQYRIKFYKSGTLIWCGYLDSELYNEDFSQIDNYSVQFTGNDGFSILERINYLDDNGNQLTDFETAWQVLTRILGKLSLPWQNLYISISTTIENISVAASETLLHGLYVMAANYIDEDGVAFDCRKVLEGLLTPLGCTIFQYNANIYIVDINTLAKGGSATFKKYNPSTFAYIADESINLNLGDVSAIGVTNSSMPLNVVNAINKQKVTFSPYIQSSIFKSSFEDSAFNKLTPIKTINNGIHTVLTDDDKKYKWDEIVYSNYDADRYTLYENTIETVGGPYYPTFERIIGTGTNNSDGNDNDNYILLHSRSPNPNTVNYYNHDYWKVKALKINKLPFIFGSSDYLKFSLSINFSLKAYVGKDNEAGITFGDKDSIIACYIKINDKYFTNYNIISDTEWSISDSGKWTTTEQPCFMKFKGKSSDAYFTNYTKKNGSDDTVDGMIIPLTPDLCGQLEIWICHNPFFNGDKTLDSLDDISVRMVKIKEIAIELCNKYGDDIGGEDIQYTAYINGLYKNEGSEIKLIQGTNINKVCTALGALMYKDTSGNYQFIKNCTREGATGYIECLLLRSIESNYQKYGIKLACTLNMLTGICGIITYSKYLAGKNFMIGQIKNNYEDAESEVTLYEVLPDSLTINASF